MSLDPDLYGAKDWTPRRGVVDLDALEAAARAATPGPWYVDVIRDMGEESFAIPGAVRWRGYGNSLRFDEDEATARFVAAVNPEAVLALIERLRKAEAPRNTDSWSEIGQIR